MKRIVEIVTMFCAFNIQIGLSQDSRCSPIDQMVMGYFNQDSIQDVLIIYGNSVESKVGSFTDTCVPHKSVIYTGDLYGGYTAFNSSYDLFPCPLFNGRSDNVYDTLILTENRIIWRTVVAPFESSSYLIETFTFRYSSEKNFFTLVEFRTDFYASPEIEEPIKIYLTESDLIGAGKTEFNMENWLKSGHIFSVQNVRIHSEKVDFWKALAEQYKEEGYDWEVEYIYKMIEELGRDVNTNPNESDQDGQ